MVLKLFTLISIYRGASQPRPARLAEGVRNQEEAILQDEVQLFSAEALVEGLPAAWPRARTVNGNRIEE